MTVLALFTSPLATALPAGLTLSARDDLCATQPANCGMNGDLVCCTPQGCAGAGNGVQIVGQGFFPNRTCTEIAIPTGGVDFRLVTERGHFNCYLDFPDAPSDITILQVNSYGQVSVQEGSGSFVGGCGKVNQACQD